MAHLFAPHTQWSDNIGAGLFPGCARFNVKQGMSSREGQAGKVKQGRASKVLMRPTDSQKSMVSTDENLISTGFCSAFLAGLDSGHELLRAGRFTV
jgi:hypothetical protein